MNAKPLINIIGTISSPEGEEKFNTWYNEKHIPDLLKLKMIKSVRRFKLKGKFSDYPKFLAIYEFENLQQYNKFINSPEVASARKDAEKIFEEVNGKFLWHVQYEEIESWQE